MSFLAASLERYAHRDSVVHRLDARAKVPAVFGYVVAIAMSREGDWDALALLAVPVVALAFLARLGPWFVLRRTFIALPFLAVALPLVFTRPGEPLFVVPLLGWTASQEGVEAVATIITRAWLAVAVAVLLVSSTPVVEILRALRTLRVPRLLVATIFFTYRYLFVIGEEGQRMMRARDSRSARVPGRRAGRTVVWRARILGHMVGSLFVRSLERSERVYAAMQARGYTGEHRFLDQPPLRAEAVAACGAFVAYAAAVQLWTRLL
ncbi:MAG: cobalt ECF transporter T component CbiQ [Dehalococcoidia bacterium]